MADNGQPDPVDEPTILITFDTTGHMAIRTTPDIDLDKLVLASFGIMRQANAMADRANQPNRATRRASGLVTPERTLKGLQ